MKSSSIIVRLAIVLGIAAIAVTGVMYMLDVRSFAELQDSLVKVLASIGILAVAAIAISYVFRVK